MRTHLAVLIAGSALLWVAGCTNQPMRSDEVQIAEHVRIGNVDVPETRAPVALPTQAEEEHRAVMRQHLETMQAIVAALADEDYELAKGLTETHRGFFTRRQVLMGKKADDIPLAYDQLAMAHRQVAQELADTLPTRDLKQILPRFNAMLKSCVACHLEYRVKEKSH